MGLLKFTKENSAHIVCFYPSYMSSQIYPREFYNLTNNSNVRGAFVQPLLQWESNKYYIMLVCVCSLRYPACKANAP